MSRPQTILFDVDGTLITSGGAGGKSWRRAFNELYGIPADIGQFSDAGMTDPVVDDSMRLLMNLTTQTYIADQDWFPLVAMKKLRALFWKVSASIHWN